MIFKFLHMIFKQIKYQQIKIPADTFQKRKYQLIKFSTDKISIV